MEEVADIVVRFEAAFERIRLERMAGVPILNSALSVAMTGLRDWNGYQAGVLVTPWFINAVLIGGDDEAAGMAPGTKKTFRLPAGPFEFIRSAEDGLGGFWMCSLFSPVFEFADQETALAVADAAFTALMDGAAGEDEAEEDMERIWRGELPETGKGLPADGHDVVSAAEEEDAGGEPKSISRRAFLTAVQDHGEPA